MNEYDNYEVRLRPGDQAPDFTLTSSERVEIQMSQYLSVKQVVLLFFPLAFSSTCREELCQTRDNLKLYNEFDAVVLGISVDSIFALNAFKQAENLNFRLLSDFNREVSSRYGVLYEDYFGMKGVAKRSVFVLDKNGRIKHTEILEDSGRLPDFRAVQTSLMR